MKRIMIVGANTYNPNLGVGALAISAIKMLDDLKDELKQDIEICVYNHEFTNTIDYILLPDRVIKFRNIYPTKLFNFRDLYKLITSKWRLYNLKEFLKVDYILNISAGDSFSDLYGENIFNTIDEPDRLARIFHKKMSFLPQTYGPFNITGKTLEKALKSLNYADVVLARDNGSYNYIKSLSGELECYEAIDLAFMLPYKKDSWEGQKPKIGLNVSQIMWKEKSRTGHKYELATNYQHLIRSVIRFLLSKNLEVHLIPHVTNRKCNDNNEYFISYQLYEEYKCDNLFLSPYFMSPIHAKNYISSMELFIGSRMHACIGAFSSNVPVLLLGYSKKFSGLFKDTLNYNYLLDLTDNVSEREVFCMLDNMMCNREAIKNQIIQCNNSIVKERLSFLYSLITKILQ